MGDASLDVAGLSYSPEPAITRARTATIAARYHDVSELEAHVSVLEGWHSPPEWFDVLPARDIVRAVMQAVDASTGEDGKPMAVAGVRRPR